MAGLVCFQGVGHQSLQHKSPCSLPCKKIEFLAMPDGVFRQIKQNIYKYISSA